VATSAQLARFRANNAELVRLAQGTLTEFWASLNVAGNPLDVKSALLAFFPELVTSYGDAAALLGADFYDETRNVPVSASRFRATLAAPPKRAQSLAVARWGLGPLFEPDPNPGQALIDLLGATQRMVLQAGRTSIITAAGNDPVRTGFARIPIGKTCPWCTMLASRGFVYWSEESAGEFDKWHNDCDCAVVAGTDSGSLPEDYDLTLYESAYADGSGIGRED
jgi:hypothetical protein